MRILASAAFILALSLTGQAKAAIIEFYEGNNCRQDKLLSIDTATAGTEFRSLKNMRVRGPFQLSLGIQVLALASNKLNDEIRSARISSNWRRNPEPRNGKVSLYDHPDGKTSDDWVTIVIADATKIPQNGVCIPSFERNFDRDGVYLERHPHNGLDGKISAIRADCDAACRQNLTSAPGRTVVIAQREDAGRPPVIKRPQRRENLQELVSKGNFSLRPLRPGAVAALARGKGCAFFEHGNGGGERWHKAVEWIAGERDGVTVYGQSVPDIGQWWNDRISSIRCDQGENYSCAVKVHEHGGFQGGSRVFHAGQGLVNMPQGWNDRISSYAVYCAYVGK